MDAKLVAKGILAVADKWADQREAERIAREQAEDREKEFNRQRCITAAAIDSRDTKRAGEAAEALAKLRELLVPIGADFWAEHYLADVLKADAFNSEKFAALILKVALYDGDQDVTKGLIETAVQAPKEKLGDVAIYVSELLECWWVRGRFPGILANGNPCLDATPFTTEFDSVDGFAKALTGLDGFSRPSLDRLRRDGKVITLPPWEPNATGAHRYKFCDATVQRKVLNHLRTSRTLGTMLYPDRGPPDSAQCRSADETTLDD